MRVCARWPGAAGGGESGENKGRAGEGAGLGSEFWFLWLLSSQLSSQQHRDPFYLSCTASHRGLWARGHELDRGSALGSAECRSSKCSDSSKCSNSPRIRKFHLMSNQSPQGSRLRQALLFCCDGSMCVRVCVCARGHTTPHQWAGPAAHQQGPPSPSPMSGWPSRAQLQSSAPGAMRALGVLACPSSLTQG